MPPAPRIFRLPPVAALAWISLGGCYASHELPTPDEPCDPEPVCLEDASPICLREVDEPDFVEGESPACHVIEVVATSDACAESGGRVHVALEAEGIASVLVDAEVLELAPGEHGAGVSWVWPDTCDPCGGGASTDRAEVGRLFRVGRGVSPTETDLELVLLGRGTRYRVVVCALAR